MASFYGNMKNNSRASFIFDKIYPSRAAMEDALYAKDGETSIGDGIFINRYVLVDYHYLLADTLPNDDSLDGYYTQVDATKVTANNYTSFFVKEVNGSKVSYVPATSFIENDYYVRKIFVDRYNSEANLNTTVNNLVENKLYARHRMADWERYKASYDCTVWMKIYADSQERYIMVGELNAKAPIMEFIDDAPSCQNGNGHLDQRISTDLNYLYYIPKNWDIILNTYSPDMTYPVDSDEGHYYQIGPFVKTQDIEIQEGKIYYNLFYEQADLTVGQPLDNNIYYVLTDVEVPLEGNPSPGVFQIYVKTEDETAQDGVDYYYKVFKEVDFSSNNSYNINTLYENVNEASSFNTKIKYPYYNSEGFNKRTQSKVSKDGEGIFFTPVTSAQQYPKHIFVHAGVLTKDTYLPNKYFIYNGEKRQIEANHEFNPNYAYYVQDSQDATKYNLIYLILGDDGLYRPAVQASTYYYDADLENPSLFIKSTNWENNTAYYELTWQFDENGNKVVEHKNDTYRVDVYFPSLGNAMSDIYDIVYGQPRIAQDKNDEYNNIIGYANQDQINTYGQIVGYCSQTQLEGWTVDNAGPYITNQNNNHYLLDSSIINSLSKDPNNETGQIIPVYNTGVIGYCSQNDIRNWEQDLNGNYITGINHIPYDLTSEQINELSSTPTEEKNIPVYIIYKNGDYQGGGKTFDLTDDQISELSPEIIPGKYDIPIYAKEGSNIRPYDDKKIYAGLVTPYDNISSEDVSLGWMLTLLKQYLSELRYLSTAGGMQADWVVDDSSFGYINNKPNLITTYQLTEDTSPTEGKYYYIRSIEDGEIIFTKIDLENDRIIGYIKTDSTLFNAYSNYIVQNVTIENDYAYYRVNGTIYRLSSENANIITHDVQFSNVLTGDYVVPVYDLYLSRDTETNPAISNYYELPKTLSSETKATVYSTYIRCGANTPWVDEPGYYYMSNGYGGYIPAQYVTYNYVATPKTIDDAAANATNLIQYSNKYIIISEEIDENDPDPTITDQIITQREYGCEALHDESGSLEYANIGLYFGEPQNEGQYSYIGKPVKEFNIVVHRNPGNDEADNILLQLLDLNTSINTKTIELDILNNILDLNTDPTFSSNVSVSIKSDYINTDWPIITTLSNAQQNHFFYAIRSGEKHEEQLTEALYNEDPTKYYYIKKELKEMDQYEIHNIWNSVSIQDF